MKIEIYIDDGRVYGYDVANEEKGREHSAAIVANGYRHLGDGYLEHYPPHRILKVKVTGKIESMYPDTVRGT